MNQYPFYIACAELTTRTELENAMAMHQAQAIARAMYVPFLIVTGAYKGAPETSLALYGEHAERCARALAVVFEQESYLAIWSEHSAALLGQDGMSIVTFTQRVAGTPDNFTQIAGGAPFTFV